MTFIAIDDEPLALKVIENHASRFPEWNLLATFTNVHSALDFLKANTVDLILSDINMPDISGLEFVQQLGEERPMVIFITAYQEHALKGFELEVVDYLLKPVDPERFKKSMNKAHRWFSLQQTSLTANSSTTIKDDFFYVYAEYEQIKILTNDILYIEGMGDYVKIFLNHSPKPVITLERMKHLLDMLKHKNFIRIHRSYIINVDKIEAKQKSKIRINGQWLPVGETYAASIQIFE